MGSGVFLAGRSERLCYSVLRSSLSCSAKSRKSDLNHCLRFGVARLRRDRVFHRFAIRGRLGVFVSMGRKSLWTGRFFHCRSYCGGSRDFLRERLNHVFAVRRKQRNCRTKRLFEAVARTIYARQLILGIFRIRDVHRLDCWHFRWILFVLYPHTVLIYRFSFLGFLIIAAVGVWRSADAVTHSEQHSRTFSDSAKKSPPKPQLLWLAWFWQPVGLSSSRCAICSLISEHRSAISIAFGAKQT